MMNEYKLIGRRLRELRERHRDSALDLAAVLGCAGGTVYHYEKGRRKITLVDLKKIADHYGVSLAYFLGRETEENRGAAALKRLANEVERLHQQVKELKSDYMVDTISVALIGTVPGSYSDFRGEEEVKEFYPIRRVAIHPEGAYCLRVTDNSMINRGIFDGDIVFVDKMLKPCDGDIVIACKGDEAVIRVYREDSDGPYLEAANKGHKKLPLKEVEIIGVAVESKRTHR